jgi:hypothetical protein
MQMFCALMVRRSVGVVMLTSERICDQPEASQPSELPDDVTDVTDVNGFPFPLRAYPRTRTRAYPRAMLSHLIAHIGNTTHIAKDNNVLWCDPSCYQYQKPVTCYAARVSLPNAAAVSILVLQC